MIGSGFMQAPKRIAWCARCEGPVECDERGCVVCAPLRDKHASYQAAFMVDRRQRLRAANLCINAISHGPPEPGKTKCTRCLEQHRRSNR